MSAGRRRFVALGVVRHLADGAVPEVLVGLSICAVGVEAAVRSVREKKPAAAAAVLIPLLPGAAGRATGVGWLSDASVWVTAIGLPLAGYVLPSRGGSPPGGAFLRSAAMRSARRGVHRPFVLSGAMSSEPPVSSEPPASPSSVNAWLIAQATYPVLFVIFIGVFGGLHPSAERIDERVIMGALLVALVNLPWCFVLLRRLRRAGPREPFLRGTAGLAARLVFAVWVLDSIAANGHSAARRGYHQRQARARATRDASPMRPPSSSPDASR